MIIFLLLMIAHVIGHQINEYSFLKLLTINMSTWCQKIKIIIVKNRFIGQFYNQDEVHFLIGIKSLGFLINRR